MPALPQTDDVARALALARKVHAGQTRKGPKREPYVVHVTEVAEILAEATDATDPVLIIGGLLHDAVEDGDLTPEDLAQDFGAEVAELVAEVTDPQGLSEAARRQNQIDHAPHMSVRGRMLKIADKTSNIEEITADPPHGWSAAKIRAYVTWGEDVVAGCRGLNAKLEERFDAALAAARERFGAETA